MKFGSLFAGIGGFDLGLERAGMECKWQVEIDPYCLKVLEKHWPHVKRYTDIRGIRKGQLEPVDLICGGFPCQDLSVAGKRAGLKDGTRSGLWSEFARIIGDLRPRYVLVENVPGLLANHAMGRVLGDLAGLGYDAEWESIPAYAVGSPQVRERVFIIANNDGKRIERCWQKKIHRFNLFSWCENVRGAEDLLSRSNIPKPVIRRDGHGVSKRLDSLGNAIVPQIAEWIGRQIIKCDSSP